MSDCRPRDSSGVQVHIAHIQGSEKSSGKEGLMITVDYAPGGLDAVHRNDAHTFVYVLGRSVVMQVKGEKEVTLTPGKRFMKVP
jgi:quercetin dioxygenase-like cupin family protein